MKPLYSSRWLPVVAGTLAIAFSFVSCDWFKGKGGNALTYEWCTIDYEDSISVGTSKAYQEMHIDFPANQDMNEADRGTVVDRIRKDECKDPARTAIRINGFEYNNAFLKTHFPDAIRINTVGRTAAEIVPEIYDRITERL